MIIHQPEIRTEEGHIIVSARVETSANTPLPKELWYKFPLQYKNAVTDRGESFFSALFMLGMLLNEEIEVRGKVSPKLAIKMEEYKKRYHQEDNDAFNLVNFNFSKLEAPNPKKTRHIHLASFSGGVDSFYAFWSHLHPGKSDHPHYLSHGLYIHGFDLILKNKESYQRLFETYTSQFDQWGLSLISCSTNIYSFYQFRINWVLAHVPSLVGAVMTLGNRVSTFTQPGNYEPNPVPTRPASFVQDFSTESLQFSAHGMELDRGDKLLKLFDWPPVQKNLRSCKSMTIKKDDLICKKCSKCINTSLMLNLYDKQKSFPNYIQSISIFHIIRLTWLMLDASTLTNRIYFKKILEKKRYDLYLIYWPMVIVSKIKNWAKKIILNNMPKSLVHHIKRIYYKKFI